MFLIFSTLLFSCNSKAGHNPLRSDTKELQHYLKSTFNEPVAKGRHYYFIVPSTQCKACNFFNYDAHRFGKELNQQLTVISGYPAFHFSGFVHFLHDSTNGLVTMPLIDYTNKLLVTKNGKIVKVFSPGTNLYSLLDSLKRNE